MRSPRERTTSMGCDAEALGVEPRVAAHDSLAVRPESVGAERVGSSVCATFA
jgi:hypothetical protein